VVGAGAGVFVFAGAGVTVCCGVTVPVGFDRRVGAGRCASLYGSRLIIATKLCAPLSSAVPGVRNNGKIPSEGCSILYVFC